MRFIAAFLSVLALDEASVRHSHVFPALSGSKR
jgi:hypothetical protein